MRLVRLCCTVLPLALLACNDTVGGTADVPAAIPIESQTFAASLGVNLAASTKTTDGLYYRDVTVGAGTLITTNHTLQVYYAGYLPDGSLFDSRTSPGATFQVLIGTGAVIKGWDEGILGMRVGGTRQLIIPPALGYGTSGNGAIPGNANLVFTVTVVSTT